MRELKYLYDYWVKGACECEIGDELSPDDAS